MPVNRHTEPVEGVSQLLNTLFGFFASEFAALHIV